MRRPSWFPRQPLTLLLPVAAVLVAVTVWNQTGSRSKFRRRVYHLPPEEESWEEVRENILNYNEEGGGEQDQVHTHTLIHTHPGTCSSSCCN